MSDVSGPDGRALAPETLDELISAQLDGELDAAARDLGLDPALAAESLRATPGADDRRRALDAARAALAAPVPPLDDLARRRLVARAVGRAPRSRRGRERVPWPAVWSGSAAALLLAALGVMALLGGRDDGGDQTALSGAGGAGAGAEALQGEMPDLGEISDPQVLRRRAEELGLVAPGGAEEASPEAAEGEGSAAVDVPSTTAASDARSTAGDDADADAAPPAPSTPPDCTPALATDFAAGQPALWLATGTHGGRPAGIAAFDAGGRVLVVVYALDDCRVLASQSFEPSVSG